MIRFILYVFTLLALVSPAHANSFFPADAVEEFKLSNGMTFLLMPHGETPVFTAYIRVRVGGIDEIKGETGIAHVIEHMAFKGTETWGSKDWPAEQKVLAEIEVVGQKLAQAYRQHGKQSRQVEALREQLATLYKKHQQYVVPEALAREYQRRGGLHLNATTSQDLTSYFVSLPSSEIKFWAELESERLFKPIFREFYRERDVVLEERRMRVVDDPSGAFFTAILDKAFQVSPYRRPTIGYEQDLLELTRTQAEEFFKKYYRPDQTTGAIVGQFNVDEVKKLLQATFGKIPAATTPKPELKVALPKLPRQQSECRVDLQRPAQPRLAVSFYKPTMPSPEDYAFDILATVLADGRTSRLYRSLVIEKGLAVSVNAYASVPGSRLPNLFMIFAVPRPGIPLDRLREETMTELKKLHQVPLDEKSVRLAKKQLQSSQVWRLEKNDSLASELSYFQALIGDWKYLVNYSDNIEQVSVQQLQELAKNYLVPGNMCLGFLHHGKSEGGL